MTKDCLVWVIYWPTLFAVVVIAPDPFTFKVTTTYFYGYTFFQA
jgi:hypothetical protein